MGWALYCVGLFWYFGVDGYILGRMNGLDCIDSHVETANGINGSSSVCWMNTKNLSVTRGLFATCQ